MVNFRKLTDRAKDAVDKRGGTDAFKADAKEVAGIMKGKGSLKEKAQKAKEAVKDPGAKSPEEAHGSAEKPGHTAGGAEARQHGEPAGKTDPADAVGVSHAQPPVDSADEADKQR